MPRIDREEVERVARLARLRLAPDEAAALAAELDAVLGYVDQLAAEDTRSVDPTAHVIPLETPLRDDRVEASLPAETAVGNAPAREGSAFAVPAILEDEEEA